MEEESADSCEEERCGDGESCDDGYENRRTEHCEEVLGTENRHPALAKSAGVVNGFVCLNFCHITS